MKTGSIISPSSAERSLFFSSSLRFSMGINPRYPPLSLENLSSENFFTASSNPFSFANR